MFKTVERYDKMPKNIAPDRIVIIGGEDIFITGNPHLLLGKVHKPNDFAKKKTIKVNQKRVRHLGERQPLTNLDKCEICDVIVKTNSTADFSVGDQVLQFIKNDEVVGEVILNKNQRCLLGTDGDIDIQLSKGINPIQGEAMIEFIFIQI